MQFVRLDYFLSSLRLTATNKFPKKTIDQTRKKISAHTGSSFRGAARISEAKPIQVHYSITPEGKEAVVHFEKLRNLIL
jgi:hypothetical protein